MALVYYCHSVMFDPFTPTSFENFIRHVKFISLIIMDRLEKAKQAELRNTDGPVDQYLYNTYTITNTVDGRPISFGSVRRVT